tara:strand:+ start:154 stop:552 length:399 start_codon:yes stop_codon:yes gene_type:complete
MAITNPTKSQIRDLLNRPRGLNDGTIDEYITIRSAQITRMRRSSTLYGLGATSGVSDTECESAIKFLVCVDCLRVMIDTIPMYVPEAEQRRTDIRLSAQLKSFEAQADRLLKAIAEAESSAFAIDSSNSRQV